MIKTVATSLGPHYYAVCSECKTEERVAFVGIEYSESALPGMAMPPGWMHDDVRHGVRTVRLNYCPRCSVRPECRV
jgi:hypothetical protein